MSKVIYKYQLETTGIQRIYMPFNAEILTTQVQNGILCIWALVNPETIHTECRTIEIHGTGNPMVSDVKRKYIGTYQTLNGAFVGHVFEKMD